MRVCGRILCFGVWLPHLNNYFPFASSCKLINLGTSLGSATSYADPFSPGISNRHNFKKNHILRSETLKF
ncbi:hypothetical protein L6164_024057 [Bauhinia variegata]|uniref:Uncharacterized protein n=1 Tax=Bauhinia variegata TaxID=167791 RepID=A0ACB9LXW4_BAUVA|nr:hypothetical protein L6164_024057 [Bauhinia variegata]